MRTRAFVRDTAEENGSCHHRRYRPNGVLRIKINRIIYVLVQQVLRNIARV